VWSSDRIYAVATTVGVVLIAALALLFMVGLTDTFLQYFVLQEMPFREGDFLALLTTNIVGLGVCVSLLVLHVVIRRKGKQRSMDCS